MPIDERLRAALEWQPDHEPGEEPDLLGVIVGRATRRRRIRVAGVGFAAAAAAALVAIGLPWAMSRHDLDGQPVDDPPPSRTSGWTLSESPVDNLWEGSQGAKADRLAALDGTGFERFGNALYAKHFARSITGLKFFNGEVSLSTTHMAPVGAPSRTLHGAFRVLPGHTIVMQFDEVSGTTTFRWTQMPDRTCLRLELTFVSTTVSRLYDVPAEAFFRMWSAGPLQAWGC
jgi:hypothetical protein